MPDLNVRGEPVAPSVLFFLFATLVLALVRPAAAPPPSLPAVRLPRPEPRTSSAYDVAVAGLRRVADAYPGWEMYPVPTGVAGQWSYTARRTRDGLRTRAGTPEGLAAIIAAVEAAPEAERIRPFLAMVEEPR
ncbi:hypothetical protein [Marinactinospora rubrisoli]|uniref:Uncharacterized protein n=1 Tax=Marinactinospora rubrisoli TaxID=2715399 RepID=A0ABW2KF42_9ACTN